MSRREVLAVSALTLVGFGFRVAGMDESPFGDELFTVQVVHQSGLGGIVHLLRAQELSPPLYFFLAWGTAKLGDPMVWMRVPSLLAGTATVPVVYLLGRRTMGAAAGLVGAAIVALSPFAIFYSVEARAYALMTFLIAVSTLALVIGIEDRRRRWLVLYAVASCAALYAHYTAVFAVGAQALWVLWAHRERFRELLVANLAIAVAYLPWLPFIQRGGPVGIIQLLYPFSAESYFRGLAQLIPATPFVPMDRLPGVPTLVVLAVLLAVALAFGVARAARRWRAGARPDPRSPTALLVVLLLSTPLGLLIYSLLGQSIYLPRNLLSSLPALAVLLGALFTRLRAPASYAAIGLGLAAIAFGAVKMVASDDYQRPPMKEVAAYIRSKGNPDDPVLQLSVLPGPASRSLAIQLSGHRPPTTVTGDPAVWRRAAESHRTAFVVAPARLRFDPNRRPPTHFGSLHLVQTRVFPGLSGMAVYVYAARRP